VTVADLRELAGDLVHRLLDVDVGELRADPLAAAQQAVLMREEFRLRASLDARVPGRHRMRGVSGDPGDAAVLDPDQDAAVTVADPAE